MGRGIPLDGFSRPSQTAKIEKMYQQKKIQWIGGPAGFLSIRELPAPDTVRWVARRKAEVVMAIRTGLITEQDACRRYRLSPDELAAWTTAFELKGINGLRITKARHNFIR